MKIITQEGAPVDGHPLDEDEIPTPEEDLRAIAQDTLTGFRKLKNSAILKIGVIAVALKIVGVAGEIIIENQRLKAALKDRQQQREQDEQQ